MALAKKQISRHDAVKEDKELEKMGQFNQISGKLGPFGKGVAIVTTTLFIAGAVAFGTGAFSKKHEPKTETVMLLQKDTFDISKYADAPSMLLYSKMDPVSKKDFENWVRIKNGYPPLKYYVPEVVKFLEDKGFLSSEWTPTKINWCLLDKSFYDPIPEEVLGPALSLARQNKKGN